MEHSMPRKTQWGGVAKKLICSASALALAGALVPATALATDTMNGWTDLPTQAKDFKHTDSDNTTYTYATVGNSTVGRVAPMAQTYYEVLGLNYVNAYRGPDTIYAQTTGSIPDSTGKSGYNKTYTQGSSGSLKTKNSTLAIMGTSNNIAPDEYIWNYCCWANGATSVEETQRAMDKGNSFDNRYNAQAISVKVGESTYDNFPREIYMECDIINTSSTDGTALKNNLAWTKWVELENQRVTTHKSGASSYAPVFANIGTGIGVATGSPTQLVAALRDLAKRVDSALVSNASKNSNKYTVRTRYGDYSTAEKSANASENSVAQDFEDIVQATRYYTMSKIEDGTVEKKVSALLVGYDPATGNYACRVYDGGSKDPGGNYYGGRVANYLSAITTSITELGLKEAQKPTTNSKNEQDYVRWYTPAQIARYADVVFGEDVYSENSVSDYLATASDGKAYTVYCEASVEHAAENRTAALVKARNELIAAKKPHADFCFSYPANMFGNFYAQGVENGMLSFITAAFTYPSIFGANGFTDMFAYWAKHIWHIDQGTNNATLQAVVTNACDAMSLSSDQAKIGTISSDFETRIKNDYIKAGYEFYLQHQTEMDKLHAYIDSSDDSKSVYNLKTYNLDSVKSTYDSDGALLNKGDALAKNVASPTKVTNDETQAKSQSISVKTSISKSYKVKKLKKKAQSFKIGASASTDVSYKVTKKNSKISVDSAGKVTVKKGTKKGTYKVTVAVTAKSTASAAGGYSAATKNVNITVKVKK